MLRKFIMSNSRVDINLIATILLDFYTTTCTSKFTSYERYPILPYSLFAPCTRQCLLILIFFTYPRQKITDSENSFTTSKKQSCSCRHSPLTFIHSRLCPSMHLYTDFCSTFRLYSLYYDTVSLGQILTCTELHLTTRRPRLFTCECYINIISNIACNTSTSVFLLQNYLCN